MNLRQDFISILAEIGYIPLNSKPSSHTLNKSSNNLNLVKAVVLGGLWPRVARIQLPKDKIKYDKVSAGTVQRENTAKDFKIFDLQDGRVFLHPGSVLFSTANWKPPFLTYFSKHMTSKIFLRDASKVGLVFMMTRFLVDHCFIGSHVWDPPFWGICLCEPCSRWDNDWKQR